MLLHPLDDRFIGSERQVELVTFVGNQREAEERAADAVIFSVEEVPQRCATGVQSSVGSGRPLRQRSCAMR
jgi:hypothetical protein